MKSHHSVLRLCQLFEVSLSGYYDWQKRQLQPGKRAKVNQALVQEIKTIHAQSRKTYGSPRIANQLRKHGLKHGRNRIARLMKEQHLFGRQKRRYRLCTTDSNHEHPIAPNRLAQAPKASKINQIWVADITYIPTKEGWLFLAAILDLYSRKIVGWNMSPRLDTQLILNALQMALLTRQPPARGVQYASNDYRQALARAGLLPSMSRKGNCYDNAVMESFWSTLKLELVYRTKFITRQEARAALFDYIESFYNRRRSHSALNYLSPVDFQSLNN
jgi:transposase InsO family protein